MLRMVVRLALIASAILAGTSLAACGQVSGSPAAQPTENLTPVEWVEQFCVAVVAARPADDSLTRANPTDRAAVTDALTKQIEAFDVALGKLDQIGTSPVQSGDEGLRRTKDAMTRAKAAFSAARDKIAALPPGDNTGAAAALRTAAQEASAAFDQLGSGLDDRALREAAKSAPTCKANGLD